MLTLLACQIYLPDDKIKKKNLSVKLWISFNMTESWQVSKIDEFNYYCTCLGADNVWMNNKTKIK